MNLFLEMIEFFCMNSAQSQSCDKLYDRVRRLVAYYLTNESERLQCDTKYVQNENEVRASIHHDGAQALNTFDYLCAAYGRTLVACITHDTERKNGKYCGKKLFIRQPHTPTPCK